MSEQIQRGDELFEALNQTKKKRRRKLVRNVLITLVVVAVVLVVALNALRRNVEERFASAAAEVQAYTVTTGTINTTVTGSGVLTEVDLEKITVPEGVEITEVMVETGDTVARGDLLAQVDMATVMTSLSALQEEMDALDKKISDAKGETVSSTVKAGISGRVKILYADAGMDVSACMAEHGALAVLSLDGKMAVDVNSAQLKKGDAVVVTLAEGDTLEGSVTAAAGGMATVLFSDDGPAVDEQVSVSLEDGTMLGSGSAYIHNPLAVTGYAGTISRVNVKENARVSTWTSLFTLKDTSFSANYDTLLRQRGELEETLLELLTLYRDGALLAAMDGVVSSVDFDDGESTSSSTPAASASAASAAAYSSYYGYSAAAAATAASAAAPAASDGTEVLTLYPNIAMSVTIGVDETDILALKEGQTAKVEVSSAGEEPFEGLVTGISKVADTSSGVSVYSAEVTLPKAEGMLAGMTASVDVEIEGVENALIIPVDALHQTSATYYVYTGYDPETSLYSGMTTVTVGMRNDKEVEILSGLSQGDVIYYTEQENFFSMISSMMSGGRPGGNAPGRR